MARPATRRIESKTLWGLHGVSGLAQDLSFGSAPQAHIPGAKRCRETESPRAFDMFVELGPVSSRVIPTTVRDHGRGLLRSRLQRLMSPAGCQFGRLEVSMLNSLVLGLQGTGFH